MRKIKLAIIGAVAAVALIAAPASANFRWMTWSELTSVWSGQLQGNINSSTATVEGNCYCSGTVVNRWTDSNGKDWKQVSYDGYYAGDNAIISYKFSDSANAWLARHTWWCSPDCVQYM